MAQDITVTYQQLIEAAEAEVTVMDVNQAMALLDRDDHVFVDIRDIRELDREGRIPGAIHAPRGMLEFWVCPTSPYHKPIFAEDKTFIFFCAGGWRSALAAQQMQAMGLKPVAHMAGGFGAWREAGGAVDAPDA